MADENVLQIGAMVDAGTIQAGMDRIASSVEAGTAAASESMAGMAGATTSSMAQIEAALSTAAEFMSGVMSGALEELKAQFASIPAASIPPIAETEGALTGLQEKLVQVAETAEAASGGIGAGFGGLAGILGAGALAGLMGHFADETNKEVLELGHLAEKSGISIASLAGLQQATRELGVSFESVSTGMVRLERAQALAVEGGKAQQAAFERIGITLADLQSLTPEQLFGRVSQGIQDTASSADAAASAIALLGRGGAALIPIFKEYGGTITDVMRQQGESNGINQEAYENALQFQKASADLGIELRKLALDVMPGLTKALHDIQQEFKSLGSDESVAEIKAWGGKVAAVIHELQGTADASGVKLRDFFASLPGLPQDKALARHQEDARELQAIWERTAKQVNQDLGNFVPEDTIEQSLHRAIKLAEEKFPTRPNTPEGGVSGNNEKEAEAKATAAAQQKLAEETLQTQLASIEAWKSQQKLAYEQGEIDISNWANAQMRADNMASAAHSAYFDKLMSLERAYFAQLQSAYSKDPAKLALLQREEALKMATIEQDRARTVLKETTKDTDDYAQSVKKLNDILREYGFEVLKSADNAQKELDEDLKKTGKSIQDYVASLTALGRANEAAKGPDFKEQAEAIRGMADAGEISQVEASKRLIALYQQQANSQIAILNEQLDRQMDMVRQAQEAMTEAEMSGDAVRINETKAAYNNQLAAITQTQTQIQAVMVQTTHNIQNENNKVNQSFQQLFRQITGPLNQFMASWLTSQQTLAQAWNSLVTGMAQNFIRNLMLMAEEELVALALHKAAAKQGVIMKAKEAAAWGFAEGMKLPFPLDVVMAPTLAALAFTGVMAFGTFAKGGVVDEDMIARLHPDEMVLPPALSTGVQNLIQSGGTAGGNQAPGRFNTNAPSSYSNSSQSIGGNATSVHIHMGDVQTLDSDGMNEVLKKYNRDIAKTVQKSIMSGHLTVARIGGF